MIDLYWCLNFSYYFSALLMGAVGLFLIVSTKTPNEKKHHFFIETMLLSMLISFADLILMISKLYENAVIIHHITEFIWYLLNMLMFPVMTAWLLHICNEKLRRSPAFYTVCIIQIAKLLVMGVTMILYELYHVSHLNGTLNPITALGGLLGATLLVANVAILVPRWRKLTTGQRIFFILCDILTPELMILLMEVFLISEQKRKALMYVDEVIRQRDEILRQKKDLARHEAQVAVLQLRPHFIHNTLMSIYYLCRQDADKAQQVILDFNHYLKKNFTAITREDTVPFTEELEHARAYLAVEKVRFPDKLFVEFDTPVTVFKLPPLTLQPIVENSVKYGISPDLEPLYLSIITEEADDGISIIVEDTGPGYNPSDDNAPHIALDNIRERLNTMCNGTLDITPRNEGGTKVTIRIPVK